MMGQVLDSTFVRTWSKLKVAEYGRGIIHLGGVLSSDLTLKLSMADEDFEFKVRHVRPN